MNDKSWQLRILYSGILLATYFGFFALCAFKPTLMGHTVFQNNPATISMVVGGLIIAGCVVLTGLYMNSADKV